MPDKAENKVKQKKTPLEIILPVFTMLLSIAYLVLVIICFVQKDYQGVFWRYLVIPGLAVLMALQGLNTLVKKDAENKTFTYICFGIAGLILVGFIVSLFL